MAGTTRLELATSAVTECNGYKNHRLTDHFSTFQEPVSPLESMGVAKLYLCLYLCLRFSLRSTLSGNLQDRVPGTSAPQLRWGSPGALAPWVQRMGEFLAGLCTGFKYIEINILSERDCIQNAG